MTSDGWIDILGHFDQKQKNYTFFSSAHGLFPKIDCILGHKTSLNKFKKIDIISSVFSSHPHVVKLEINYKKKTEKHTDMETK